MRAVKRLYQETENEVISGEGIAERFRRGVRQRFPLSVLLFSVYLVDLKERWKRKNLGEAVVVKCKIFCFKFANDVIMMADTPMGWRKMLKDVEKFSEENEMKVNEEETKVMIFRKGGILGEEKWKYKNRDLQVGKEYKYLACWFTSGL